MKKIFFCMLIFWVINLPTNAQTNNLMSTRNDHKPDADFLLQKSKNKKKVAWIMAGGGSTLLLAGIIIPRGEVIRDNIWWPEYKNDGIKQSLALTGILSMLGSIPFFISSHHNKKKATSLTFKNEPVQQINNKSIAYRNIPSLTLQFKL
ncbi:MAG TPA: hypothetical protein VMY77_05665 [Chitinophagaceae bacterium]|nr:hypothetical protein [Chitinophagaceae bacterium]